MKPQIGVTILCFALSSLLGALRAEAQLEGTYEVQIKKKADQKKASRWTLTDWLSWKEQQKAMDLWLAKNSHSSPFEFFLESGAVNYDRASGDPSSAKSNSNLYDGALGAYAGIAGLRGTYQYSQENQSVWSGSFNLRIFGRAIQDTHINLEYGLRGLSINRDGQSPESFQNQFGGVELALYFTKHFGVEGAYRKVLPARADAGRTLEGEVSSGTLFIDFSALRVFGAWIKEMRQYSPAAGSSSGPSEEYREGFGGGLKLFF